MVPGSISISLFFFTPPSFFADAGEVASREYSRFNCCNSEMGELKLPPRFYVFHLIFYTFDNKLPNRIIEFLIHSAVFEV